MKTHKKFKDYPNDTMSMYPRENHKYSHFNLIIQTLYFSLIFIKEFSESIMKWRE